MHSDTNSAVDALSLLVHDHRLMRALLLENRRLVVVGAELHAKVSVVETLVKLLRYHAYLEDELLFPAVAGALQDWDNTESSFDQEDEQYLIEALDSLTEDSPGYDAKLTELSGQLEEHIRHEEEELFPRFRAASINLLSIGLDMLKHRARSF